MAPQKMLVLYATQTGNARGIANDIGERANKLGHDATVLGMEHFKKLDFSEEPLVVVVASCTGNGDCPDNGDKFLRYCKRKTTPNFLETTKFAVCSLGDSNYDAFCAVGKEFDKHFERLGGRASSSGSTSTRSRASTRSLSRGSTSSGRSSMRCRASATSRPTPRGCRRSRGRSSSSSSSSRRVAAPRSRPLRPRPRRPVRRRHAKVASLVATGAADDDDEPLAAARAPSAPVVAARWLTGAGVGRGARARRHRRRERGRARSPTPRDRRQRRRRRHGIRAGRRPRCGPAQRGGGGRQGDRRTGRARRRAAAAARRVATRTSPAARPSVKR